MHYVHGYHKVLSELEQRFWSKVKGVNSTTGSLRSGGEDPAIKCWVWQGHTDRSGYGTFYFANDRTRMAHRLAYEVVVGPIPEGMVLDHLCRKRNCVNPKHLEPVSNLENIDRGASKAVQRTHCSHGHEVDEKDTYIRRDSKGWSKGRILVCPICLEIHRVSPGEAIEILAWKRISSGHYISEVHPFQVFRSGRNWYLKVGRDTLDRVLESREQAGAAAVILLRLESDGKDSRNGVSPKGLRLDWERIGSGNYACRVHPIRVFRSGKKWRLEISGNVSHCAFETMNQAVRILYRLGTRTMEYRSHVSIGDRRHRNQWLRGCRAHGKPLRSDMPRARWAQGLAIRIAGVKGCRWRSHETSFGRWNG